MLKIRIKAAGSKKKRPDRANLKSVWHLRDHIAGKAPMPYSRHHVFAHTKASNCIVVAEYAFRSVHTVFRYGDVGFSEPKLTKRKRFMPRKLRAIFWGR